MARRIITGLDIGSSAVRVVVAEEKDGVLNILNAVQKPSDGIRNGYITNAEDAAKSIREAVGSAAKALDIPIKNVSVSMGGIGIGSVRAKETIMISKADGEVSEYDVRRAISQSEANLPNSINKCVIHSIPLTFKIDNAVVTGRPVGIKGAKLEVETLFITCLNQHISDLIKTMELAGLSVDKEDIAASPLAISSAVLTKRLKEVGCVLVDMGAGTVSIAVFENGLPLSVEIFPIGSTHITNDIALGFQVSLAEAERLKINFGADVPVSKRKLSDIIEARLNDIFELVENHLKKINRNAMLPGGIILTGGGSSLFGLEEIAKSCLKLPSKIGSIRENDSISISAPSALKDQLMNDPGWSTAIGLCIMNAKENTEFYQGSAFGKEMSGTIKKWFRSLIP